MEGETVPMPKLADLRLPSLHAGYVAGILSPVDVVRRVHQSVSSYHDKAVWIHIIPEADLLARAEQLVATHRDLDSLPPLFGVPFSVKDSIDVAGLPTTLACPSIAYTAEANAVVVESRRHPRRQDQPGSVCDRTHRNAVAVWSSKMRAGQ
jgi:allophanate hydrolase